MTVVYIPAMGTGAWKTFAGPPKELPEFPGGPALNLRPASPRVHVYVYYPQYWRDIHYYLMKECSKKITQ